MINLYIIRPKGFNIGNDIIFLGVNHFIRQSFDDVCNIISIPATSKYESQKKAGISAETVYEVNRFGHGLIIGGGNLYENDGLEISPVALKALEKPLMIFSVSRGKIYNNKLNLVDRTNVMTDEKIISINEKSAVSLSRDIETHKYINNLGCKNGILVGCPTLFINEVPQQTTFISKKYQTDAIISIRTPELMSVPITFQHELRENIIRTVELLKLSGYKNIKILCHDHRDIPFATSLRNIEYLYTEDVYTFLTFLKNTRLDVTFRLHSFLPCISYGIPSINISYDQRSLSMLETIGMEQWNINLLKDNLVSEIKHRLNHLDDLEILRNKNKTTTWNNLKNNMLNGCKQFAQFVYEQK